MCSAQKYTRSHCFFEIDPEIWRTCSMGPYPAVDECVFFRWNVLDLLRPKYLHKPEIKHLAKKNNPHPPNSSTAG